MAKRANLIKCVECGSQVSIQSDTCPQCKTLYFRSRRICVICLKEGKNSEGYTESNKWTHFSCINKILYINQYYCPTCGKKINIDPSLAKPSPSHVRTACHECGQPVFHSTCAICGRYVLLGTGRKIKNSMGEKCIIHQACYSNWRSCGGITIFGRLKNYFYEDPYYKAKDIHAIYEYPCHHGDPI